MKSSRRDVNVKTTDILFSVLIYSENLLDNLVKKNKDIYLGKKNKINNIKLYATKNDKRIYTGFFLPKKHTNICGDGQEIREDKRN